MPQSTCLLRYAPIPVWSPVLASVQAVPYALGPRSRGENLTVLQTHTVLQTPTVLQAQETPHRKRRWTRSLWLGIWLIVLPFLNFGLSIGLLTYILLGQRSNRAFAFAPTPLLFSALMQQQADISTAEGDEPSGDATSVLPAIAGSLKLKPLSIREEQRSPTPESSTAVVSPKLPGQAIGTLIHPVPGYPITSPFGERVHPISQKVRFHGGLDLGTPLGTPVQAADGGKITLAGPHGGYGNLVAINHGNGYETRYAHLDNIRVNIGDQVAQTDIIGFSGNTGYSTGPHLHFEVRFQGELQDPWPYIGR